MFVSGAASGAKDIADSILHAGSTVAQVAAYLEQARGPDHVPASRTLPMLASPLVASVAGASLDLEEVRS